MHFQLFDQFSVQFVDVVPHGRVARAVEEKYCSAEHTVDGGEGAVESHILKVCEINFLRSIPSFNVF
jgi:hypothetical protein